jgi:hypothetical protein
VKTFALVATSLLTGLSVLIVLTLVIKSGPSCEERGRTQPSQSVPGLRQQDDGEDPPTITAISAERTEEPS